MSAAADPIETLNASALRTIRAQAARIKILEAGLKLYAYWPLGLGRPARRALSKSSGEASYDLADRGSTIG